MFVHNVYFWLKDGLDDGEIAAFEKSLQSLCGISFVKSGYCGKPADTDRPVIDSSYSYGLVLMFDDKAGQDAYQVSETHQTFVAEHSAKWARVLVYDFETT